MGYDGTENVRLEQYVTEVMLEMGVPAHLKGYHYLRSSIVMAKEDMEVVGSLTKLLYPEIAKMHTTTSHNGHPASRKAIHETGTWGMPKRLRSCLAIPYSRERGVRPTVNTLRRLQIKSVWSCAVK